MLIFGEYTKLMSTRTSPVTLEKTSTKNISSIPKKKSLLQVGVNIVDMILSLVLSIIAAIGLMWLNGKQREFDKLKNKSE